MLQALKIIRQLSKYDMSSWELCELNNISVATLKREITEARHIGAKIKSIKKGKISRYHLENWTECKKRTEDWIAYEEKKSVIL